MCVCVSIGATTAEKLEQTTRGVYVEFVDSFAFPPASAPLLAPLSLVAPNALSLTLFLYSSSTL